MNTYKIDLSNIDKIGQDKNDLFFTESTINSFLDLSGIIDLYYKDEKDNIIYFDDTDHLLDIYQYETDIFYFNSDNLNHTLKFNEDLRELITIDK